MNKHYENTKLNHVIFCFLLVKLFFAILYLYPYSSDFFLVFAYLLPWSFFIISIFAPNGLLFFTLALLVFCLFFVSMVLLLMNNRSAGFASIVLIILCLLDAISPMVSALFPFFGILRFVFNIALVLMLVVLRRSRPGSPTITHDIDPTKI